MIFCIFGKFDAKLFNSNNFIAVIFLKILLQILLQVSKDFQISIATDVILKKRSGLSDQVIVDLIFEKAYFQNEGWLYK